MKRKIVKRLRLGKETLVTLQVGQLVKAGGAATLRACCFNSDSCPPPTGPCSLFCPTGPEVCQ